VGMDALRDARARVTFETAFTRRDQAVQRRRERERGRAFPRAGRAGEQIRVVHAPARDRGAQAPDHAVLTEDVAEARHARTLAHAGGARGGRVDSQIMSTVVPGPGALTPIAKEAPHFSAFRDVPRTGVIFVTAEANKRGFAAHPDEWCNLGQG